ncbi:hypothetical protein MUK42_36346, partial [Musa troglodytarum]
LLIHLKSFGQHIVGNRRRRSEQGSGGDHHPRELAVEGGDGERLLVTDVVLEVNEALGHHEHLAGLQDLGEELVVGADEPHQQSTLEEDDELDGSRVVVGLVEAVGGDVDAVHGDAEGVESREVEDVRRGHAGTEDVAGVALVGQPGEEEVVGRDVGDRLAREPINDHGSSSEVGNAEVLEGEGRRGSMQGGGRRGRRQRTV